MKEISVLESKRTGESLVNRRHIIDQHSELLYHWDAFVIWPCRMRSVDQLVRERRRVKQKFILRKSTKAWRTLAVLGVDYPY